MTGPTVVFDCVVFAQAVINDAGPAAACLQLARARVIRLTWSDYVLAEIRELPAKLPARMFVTNDRIEAFIQDVSTFATLVNNVGSAYRHPIDPDDSHYINLAIAAGATLITSRDRHLLDLMDPSKPHAAEFRRLFPDLAIVTPQELLTRVRP
jgi:putative PIN family toxin of toxin-antitoxin system